MASKPDYRQEDDINDFSCYVTIQNNSDQDLLLADFGVQEPYGVWPLYQPLNTIEAKSSARVHLKDPKGTGGSEGWVLYEVKVGDRVEQFQLKFADPATWLSDNYLHQWSSDGNRLRVDVKPYKPSGHPFYGQVEVSTNPQAAAEANPIPRPWVHASDTLQPVVSDEVRAKFEIGFDWPGPGQKYPVHESIAIAAFTRSLVVFPKATTYNNLNRNQWEYFRGMIWNDDPSCRLFDKSNNDNRNFNSGAEWYAEFRYGSPKCMTQRSHFGNLQFLHAMGTHEGEAPRDTRDRFLKWMGVMYKLACGNQGVSELDSLRDYFSELFDGSTDPSGGTTLRDLILASRPEYKDSKISLRALGICMHIIQDSYAMGHVQRRLLNPQDFIGRDPDRHINFKPGTWGKWGAIVSFHTYGKQDNDRHSFYDGLEGADLPNPKKLESFNRLHGARDAIEACTILINAFAQKQPWKEVRENLEKEVFEIDSKAQLCNSAIDDKIPGLDFAILLDSDKVDKFDYQAGLLRKVSTLESGLPANIVYQQQSRRAQLHSHLKACVLVILLLVGVIIHFF